MTDDEIIKVYECVEEGKPLEQTKVIVEEEPQYKSTGTQCESQHIAPETNDPQPKDQHTQIAQNNMSIESEDDDMDTLSWLYETHEKANTLNILLDPIYQGTPKDEDIFLLDNPYQQLMTEGMYPEPEPEVGYEHYSILSDKIVYHNYHPETEIKIENKDTGKVKHNLNKTKIKPLPYEVWPTEKDKYLDRFTEVSHEQSNSMRFNDSKEVTTTYFGPLSGYKYTDKICTVLNFPISTSSQALGKLSDGTKVRILMDTGASKSYLSKTFYLRNECLHNIPKLSTRTENIMVGNGQLIPTMFVIPLMINIGDHIFEIYTIVADIVDTSDLVFGYKNMLETEGVIDTMESTYNFINRSIPIFLTKEINLKQGDKQQALLTIPFFEPISGIGLCRFQYDDKTSMIDLKITNNQAMIYLENKGNKDKFFNNTEAIGILDLRSLGYYRVTHGILHKCLAPKYNFVSMDKLSETYNKCMEQINDQISHHDKITPKQATAQFSPEITKTNTQPQTHVTDDVTQKSEDTKFGKPNDPYPWLEETDERRFLTDRQILNKFINLDNSQLSHIERDELREIIFKHKEAFSLRDEIGHCPNIKIDIELIDPSPFFVRPFSLREEDKPIMDWQMHRLVSLGILKKAVTSHSSPVMLISRKVTKDKRPIVDFRLLNTRIRRKNTSTPLLKDIFNMLGNSQSELLSCIDLKDAYHSIPLTEAAQELTGIIPYMGSPSYKFKVLPMGLAISPAKWIEYVNLLIDNIQHKNNYIAIMDDLLIHSKTKDHLVLFERLLQAIIKHGLKISPKKCQLFMNELVYLGNVFKVVGQRMTVKPLKSRTEAIMKIATPTTPKQCKSFCGVANYMSMFCKELQALLKPIYDLTRKGRPFLWTKIHDKAFEETKKRLTSPPVLTCPKATGRLTLYSDTSKSNVGNTLFQKQDGVNRLLGYGSKTLPTACQNYSATELELTGLCVSISLWKHLLNRTEFDCVVDHQAIIYIMKAKTEPASRRIMKLLEHLSNFSFNIYYMKGKDLIIADYLSRHRSDDTDPHSVIPISFALRDTLADQYHILTRSQAKQTGTTMDVVHGANKPLDPHRKPEHQKKTQKVPTKISAPIPKPKPKAKPTKIPPEMEEIPIPTSLPKQPKKITAQKIVKKKVTFPCKPMQKDMRAQILSRKILEKARKIQQKRNIQVTKPAIKIAKPHAKPTVTPSIGNKKIIPATVKLPIPDNTDTQPFEDEITPGPSSNVQDPISHQTEVQINTDISNIEPDSDLGIDLDTPFSENSVEHTHRRPMKTDTQLPPPLIEQIQDQTIIQKHLPKQVDLDKILKQINRKILRETHLPTNMRDMKAAYLNSQFKHLYIYLAQHKIPTNKQEAKMVEKQAQRHFLLDNLLFKLIPQGEDKWKSVLCIPTSKVDMILQQYHNTLIGSHTGMNKSLMTLNERYYCPLLANHIRAYVTGCHVCQMFKHNKGDKRTMEKRININDKPLGKISMDIKHMGIRSHDGYKYILILLCEITNYLVALPLKNTQTPEICSALVKGFIAYFGTPRVIISDQDPAFLSSLMAYLLQQCQIKLVTVSVTNHQSLLAEFAIKALTKNIQVHLDKFGTNWTDFLPWATLSYNSFSTPNLDNFAPLQLLLGHLPKILPQYEISPELPVTGTYKTYLTKLKAELTYMREKIQKFRDQRLDVMNKTRTIEGYATGQLVYMYNPRGARLQTGTRKIQCEWVGPLCIYRCLSPTNYILMTLQGCIIPHIIEIGRIKKGFIKSPKGLITSLAELKSALRTKLIL